MTDDGGKTIVQDAVSAWKQQKREVFLPLTHRPGEAQVDFGFADVHLNGEKTQVALFVMTLPYSDAIYILALPLSSFLLPHRSAASVASTRMHGIVSGRAHSRL